MNIMANTTRVVPSIKLFLVSPDIGQLNPRVENNRSALGRSSARPDLHYLLQAEAAATCMEYN